MSAPARLVLSCEHGGHRVPARYRRLFVGAGSVLQTHRGWDRGAASLARALARRTGAPLLLADVSRLLVDLNRSPDNPAVFSVYSRALDRSERTRLLAEHHAPHRERVRQEVGAGSVAVLHLAVHSFVPRLGRSTRDFDVGLLYDPKRSPERDFARAWQSALQARGWSVRRNAPYRGVTDGLPTWLRKNFGARRYLGIELEVNQRLMDASGWVGRLTRALTETLPPGVATGTPTSRPRR